MNEQGTCSIDVTVVTLQPLRAEILARNKHEATYRRERSVGSNIRAARPRACVRRRLQPGAVALGGLGRGRPADDRGGRRPRHRRRLLLGTPRGGTRGLPLRLARRRARATHAAGIGIDLATATASPPPWLTALHPEMLPMTRDGTRLWPGGRQGFCPSSPVYRERCPGPVPRAGRALRPPRRAPAVARRQRARLPQRPVLLRRQRRRLPGLAPSAGTATSTPSTTRGARRSGPSATPTSRRSCRRGPRPRSPTRPRSSTSGASPPTSCWPTSSPSATCCTSSPPGSR